MVRRLGAGAIALIVLVTLIVRLQLNMQATGNSLPEAIWVVYRFFTVWTNTLIGVLCGWVFLTGNKAPKVSAGMVLAISLVGIVYHILLAQLVDYSGLEALVDQSFHTVVPCVFVLWWVVVEDKTTLRRADLGLWLTYPAVYCLYALARGASDAVYPYPFLDAGNLGYAAVGVNALGLLVLFALGGGLILVLARALPQPLGE